MITPEEFPYVTALHVNDCYTYRDFDIKLNEYKPFSHLILTGRNGSGKSTILQSISGLFDQRRMGNGKVSVYLNHGLSSGNYGPRLTPLLSQGNDITVFFSARREVKYKSAIDGTKVLNKLSHKNIDVSNQFVQYLVNKKVNLSFDQIKGDHFSVKLANVFFDNLTAALRKIFEDKNLQIVFTSENYKFSLALSDGRDISFDSLPDGFLAFTNIISDLFTRTDLIRKKIDNYQYNPCGIVLIDEPEAHLHLELQEQVLPLLTDLFPNIQFVVATHSPAVIASIKNATIFDLTTKETRVSEETVGRSYAELTISHFGLENDYSTIADEYTRQIDTLLDSYGNKPIELIQQLEAWQRENAQFLSPTLQIKLEYIIAQQNAKLAVSQ